ncbi:hypothetical protein PSECIP111951_01475 [Pseudoalteromonas holothuriae]|uniref:Uncharacterized protein n=2 Tax=Pseudoalteromonas holothuriae TaxID=2963714 RepID=A0ABM9GGQ5_9GAMM|nr:hypothetical protein PSECIP111951_01475 [Pseudoalteromonas sp. CIP111951]
MRGLGVLILMMLAFATGVITERVWLAEKPFLQTVLEAKIPIKSSDLRAQNTPQAEAEPRAVNLPKVTNLSTDIQQNTITRLQNENEQLRQQLSNSIEQSGPAPVPNSDLNTLLTQQYKQESRDPLWADELELQLNDFLYQNDLSHVVSLQAYGCKSTVCQMKLAPHGNVQDFDEAQWRVVSEKLFAQSWFKLFTMSTSTSTKEHMVIHLSMQQVYDQ